MGGSAACLRSSWGYCAENINILGPLDPINQNDSFDLSPTLKLFFDHEDENNPLIDVLQHHKYYDTYTFLNTFKHQNSIFLGINVYSLMSKHENLSNFIYNMIKNDVKIKVIAVQETWNIPYNDLVNINGFNFVSKTRTTSRGGGIAFYVKNDIPFKMLNNHTSMQEKTFECLTIEINLNKKKLVLSNIYRSPNPPSNTTHNDHAENFINNLDAHLHNLSLCNLDTYIFLDSNINLLNINHNLSSQLYLETIFSNSFLFLQCIGKATRIVNESYSLIDHILTKVNHPTLNSGTVISDISDHFINFIEIPNSKMSKKSDHKFTRNITFNKLVAFRNDLNRLTWNNVTSCEDVNESYDAFWSDFEALFNLHFPVKKVKFNRNIHKINNFMTAGLLVSRATKLELHKKSILDPQAFHEKYKVTETFLTLLFALAKTFH